MLWEFLLEEGTLNPEDLIESFDSSFKFLIASPDFMLPEPFNLAWSDKLLDVLIVTPETLLDIFLSIFIEVDAYRIKWRRSYSTIFVE